MPDATPARTFSAQARERMAERGVALPDGSFPIPDADALRRAIRAIGRAKDPAAAKRHIVKRARVLGLTRLLPEGWDADEPVTEAVTEAERSLTSRLQAVTDAILARYAPSPGLQPAEACEPTVYVRDVFDDYAIVCRGDELYRLDYTLADDGTVTLAEPVAVAVTYQPVVQEADPAATAMTTPGSARPAPGDAGADPAMAGAPVELSEGASSRFLAEASGPTGAAWDVLLIQAGTSGNGRHYPASVLEAAAPLFEGAKAYADHPTKDELRNRPERSIRDLVGWFESVHWDAERQAIRGTFRVLESAAWLRAALKSAWDAGKRDLLGFSINALGRAGRGRHADGSTLIEAIDKVISTDVVTSPGAGGRLLGVLESERSRAIGTEDPEGAMTPDAIKTLVQEAVAASADALKADLLATVKAELPAATPAATQASGPSAPATEPVTEAVTEAAAGAVADQGASAAVLREAQAALAEIQRERRRLEIAARIDAARLPAVHAAKLKARLLEAAGRRAVDDAEVDAEVGFVRELLAEAGPARPAWGGTVAAGDDVHDKLRKALIGWFQGEAVDGVPPVRDLRESYALWTGTSYLDADPYELFAAFSKRYDSGRDHRRITESLGTSDWGQVFADVFYLQLIRAYQTSPDYDKWRLVVSEVESVPDFRTRHWARIGGYADFATVGERATYPTLTSPGDEEVTYSLSKYGGIDDISLEMVLGDRLAQVRRMPQLMAYAAARTLYKFVFNLVTTDNPTLGYDSTALYHANHANTGTTALSVAGLDAVVVAMRSQTAFGAADEILGSRNRPKLLIVPNELESRALRIVNPSDAYQFALSTTPDADTSMDPARFKGSGIMVHVYDQLTDATDWWAVADPAQMPTVVMGFLNGRTEPELFTQDQPNVGSAFTADKVSFKLRHVFGGAILDHRSFYRQVVAG